MIRASIVGATGYTGALLTDILSEHPDVELHVLTSKSYAGRSVCEVFPHLRVEGRYVQYSVQTVADSRRGLCVLSARGGSYGRRGARRCWLQGGRPERRLPAQGSRGRTATWYGFTHPRPDLVAEAVYGLPEVYRKEVAGARLVANPGCYPTGMLLGLLPVAGQIDGFGVIVDSKSGVSGAGRTPSDKTHFCAVTGNFRAYSEVGHRHTAEMLQELGLAAGQGLPVVVHPASPAGGPGHLEHPLFQASWTDSSAPTGGWNTYRAFYKGEPFVEVCDHVPGLSDVAHTNFCRMTVREDKAAGLVKVFTVIDNLVKGASGQAVQNMNCMFGSREDAGLGRAV